MYSCLPGTSHFVFTVPMRNWNRKDGRYQWTQKIGFYSTYEELKPSYLSLTTGLLSSFYSTYEELKLLLKFKIISIIERFYSTYEELKLSLIRYGTKRKIRFLQYLWGIETLVWMFLDTDLFQFLQYLWGIETFSFAIAGIYYGFVFTVPMRNWNLRSRIFER